MKTGNENQPAFPVDRDKINMNCTGLTKREYFAAIAMQGIVSALWKFGNKDGDGWQIEGPSSKTIIKESIEMADELLNQLNSTKP